jgi:hypothetical protein
MRCTRSVTPLVRLALFLCAAVLPLTIATPATAQEWAAPWDTLSGPLDVPSFWNARAIHDPVRHRMVVLVGGNPGQMWTLSLRATGTPAWTQVDLHGLMPPAWPVFSAVYDSLRDRVLVFGGFIPGSASIDLWALSLDGEPRWSPVVTLGDPPLAGRDYSLVLDPNRDRLVVFGGEADYTLNVSDLWELSLSDTPTWNPIAPPRYRPPWPRTAGSAVYDRRNDRMVFYGGWGDVDQPWCIYGGYLYYDTSVLNFTDTPNWWPYNSGPCPPARYGATTVLDAVHQRMIIVGGQTRDCNFTGVLQDAWACQFDGTPSWSQVAANGPVTTGYTGIYSPERNSVICFSGRWEQCHELDLDTGTWAQILPAMPDTFPPRQSASTLWVDQEADRLQMFGGAGSGDLWSFGLGDTTGWKREATAGYGPFSWAGMNTHDSRRDRMIAFSGGYFTDRGGTLDQVWVLPLDGVHAWTRIATQGLPPPARTFYSATYDPVRDRVLLFGGLSFRNASDRGSSRDDLWELTLGDTARWSQLAPTGTPGRCYLHTAIYDAPRDRMLVCGVMQGGGLGNSCLHDTWALSLRSDSLVWVLVNSEPGDCAEPPRATLDPLRDRLVTVKDDMTAWELRLVDPVAWRQLPIPGTPPLPRSDPGVIFDAARDRLLLLGGGTRSDLYALPFSAARVELMSVTRDVDHLTLAWGGAYPGESISVQRSVGDSTWVTLATLTADQAGRLEYVDWVLVAGRRHGYRAAVPGADRHYAETWTEVPAGHAFGFRGAVPNPARHGLGVSFTLAQGSRARLEVFDLAGRRLLTRDLGGLSPGAHSLSLESGTLRPGVYLLRLEQGGQSAVARAVVLD